MTLNQFITETIKETLSQELTGPVHNSESPGKTPRMWITETMLKDLYTQGKLDQVNKDANFTPAARDLLKQYENKGITGRGRL